MLETIRACTFSSERTFVINKNTLSIRKFVYYYYTSNSISSAEADTSKQRLPKVDSIIIFF